MRHFHYQLLCLRSSEPRREAVGCVPIQLVLDCLEGTQHLQRIARVLQRVQRLLKPGGVACIHTIDIGALLPRLLGPRWPWLMEMHLTYFSRATLARMLQETGFTVLRQFTQGRYLLLDYLLAQGAAFSPSLSRVGRGLVRRLHIGAWPVPINLGDLCTTFARKME